MSIDSKLLLTIGSCIGVAGVAVLASISKKKADEKLKEVHYEPTGEMKHDIIEPVKICWKNYIVTGVGVGMTIGMIVVNHHITAKELGAIGTCAVGSAALLSKYKEKIEERYGKEGLEDIIRDVARDSERNIQKADDVVIRSAGGFVTTEDPTVESNTLFYDEWSDTWFRSSLNNVQNARYHYNRNFALGGSIGLDSFYEFLGIRPLGDYDLSECGFGRNLLDNNIFWIDIELIESVTEDTNEQYYIISFINAPGMKDEEGDYDTDYIFDSQYLQGA